MPTKTMQHASADTYTAIAHPVRRQLLDLLAEGEHSVNQLSASFTMSRPAISQHLRILLEVGLVAEARHGRERHYELRAEPLHEAYLWLNTYEHFWNNRLQALGKFLEAQS